MATTRTDLEELLGEIRRKLEDSERARIAEDRVPLLQLAELEIHLKFVVSERSDDKGGFDLKVVSLGQNLTLSKEEVQEIILRFHVPENRSRKGVIGARHYDEKSAAPDVSPLD